MPERNGFEWVRENFRWVVALILAAVAIILWSARIDSFIADSTETHKALLKIAQRLESLEVSRQEKRDWTQGLCDEGPPNGLPVDSEKCLWIRGYPK